MLMSRQLFSDAVLCVSKQGQHVNIRGMMSCCEMEEFGVRHYWSNSSNLDRNYREGQGWVARKEHGGIITVKGDRAHEATADLEGLVMLVRLSL